jgi:hypothetical protein
MAEEERHPDLEFVEYVVKSIVDHPDEVKLTRTIDEMGVLITLEVNPEDMGQIIGKRGATVESIRKLLRVIGTKHNARVNLKIVEPQGAAKAKKATGSGEAATSSPAQETSATGEETNRERNLDKAIEDVNV